MAKKLFFALLCLALVFGSYAEGLIVEEELVEGLRLRDNVVNEIEDLEIGKHVITNDGDFEIVGTVLIGYNGTDRNVVLPYGITAIGSGVFRYEDIISVTIPNTVKTIGEQAFRNCGKLVSVILPESITSIGDHAFYECNVLTDITIPNSVTSIGQYAFYRCDCLKEISIPQNVRIVSYNAFANCSSLTRVTIHEGIKDFEGDTFESCINLKEVYLPTTLKSVTYGMFANCSSIKTITIPSSVDIINDSAFFNCESLESIYIESEKISIDASAFNGISTTATFNTHCETPATKWAREHGYNVVTTDHVAVKDKAVEPTYVKTGLTEGSHCSVCGTVLQAQKVVPQLVAKKVKLNQTKAELTVGKTLQLKATLTPAHKTAGKVKLTWTTSDPKVATVTAKGKVKAVGAGKATITVVTPNGKKATCKITVKGKK